MEEDGADPERGRSGPYRSVFSGRLHSTTHHAAIQAALGTVKRELSVWVAGAAVMLFGVHFSQSIILAHTIRGMAHHPPTPPAHDVFGHGLLVDSSVV